MMASAPCGPTVDLLIEMPSNRTQPRLLTMNENGTPSTFSAFSPPGRRLMGSRRAGEGIDMIDGDDSSRGGTAAVRGSFDVSHVTTVAVITRATRTNAPTKPADRRTGPSGSVEGGAKSDGGDGKADGAVLAVTTAFRSELPARPSEGFVPLNPATKRGRIPQFGHPRSLVSPSQSQRRQVFGVMVDGTSLGCPRGDVRLGRSPAAPTRSPGRPLDASGSLAAGCCRWRS